MAALVCALTIMGAGAAVGAGGGVDEGPHLLVVPQSPEAAAALAKSDARVVARYEAFTLVEASGDDVGRLRRADADERDDMRRVRLAGRSVDPAADRPALAGKRDGPEGPGLALVQFVGPLKDAWLERLRGTGVRLVSYMAQNAYLVHGSARELERAAALRGTDSAVRAVAEYEPEDKLAPGLAVAGRRPLAVQTLSGADGQGAREALGEQAIDTGRPAAVGPYLTEYVEMDAGEAPELARDPGVIAVLPDPEPELHGERAGQIVAGNITATPPWAPTGPGYLAFFDGLGLGSQPDDFVVDVTDEGLDAGTAPATDHPDLHEGGVLGNPSRLAYASDYTADTGADEARDCGGHGTINAGIIGGYNDSTGSAGPTAVEDAEGFNYGLGVNPRARLGGSKIFRCVDGSFSLDGGSTVTTLTNSAYANGARVSSNSWGADVEGAYNARAQEYDALVRDAVPATPGNQQMVEVFSAGNDGRVFEASPDTSSDGPPKTIGSPGTAKNVLTVGASEGVNQFGVADGCGVGDSGANDARDIIDFSSRGPTEDLRLKPDVVGPGTHITGPQAQHAAYTGERVCEASFPAGNTLYNLSSGTSHSTPLVAGLAAVVRRWYSQGHGGTPPSPALTKALVVDSTTDIAGGDDGAGGTVGSAPNDDEGFGLVNLSRTLEAGSRFLQDQGTPFDATGDQQPRVFEVADTGKPVRATLVWTDTFGPTSGNSFVNDLDLVVGRDAATYKGNAFLGGVSKPGGSADMRNNVEKVVLPAGTSGRFSVSVVAANIAGDGVPGIGDLTDQDYALVVTNATEVAGANALIGHDTTTVDPRGDGDPGLEPGEGFVLSERVLNSGTSSATGLTGALSGPPEVTLFRSSSVYPDAGPGGTSSNSKTFVGKVSAAATCGVPLGFSVDVTSIAGTTAVPFELPIGNGSSATSRSSTDVPKPIPDNDPAGVGSTLEVTQPGRIADVNVRISSIVHSFDSDLRLVLFAPDGTSVRLASRVGSNGDNFTNTVFDDEAATPVTAGSAPFTGSFRPHGDQLSRLDGKQQQGTWTLKVSDHIATDVGSLVGWGHDVADYRCTAPPTPTPPAASFNVSPGVKVGEPVTFTSTASDADGIELEQWDLDGDGQFDDAEGPSASTTFPAEGAYTVQLRVFDRKIDAAVSTRTLEALAGSSGGGGGGVGNMVSALIDLSVVKRSIRASRRGVFSLSFRSLAGLRGTVSFASVRKIRVGTTRSGKARRRRLKLGTARFTVSRTGVARVKLKLKRRHLQVLRRVKRFRVRATVRLGTLKATRTFTLKAPKRR